jgi:TetR/AcrR family transcriptional regulator, fatty acid metabolism regulator protein
MVCPFGTLAVTLSMAERALLPLTGPLRSKPPIDEKKRPPGLPSGRVSVHSSTSKVRHSDKYQRILDAAILVIAENGYFQSRVSEIADRAGVADGTIYLYFKNKEEILKAAITSAFKEFLMRARDELRRTTNPVEQLNRLAYLHLSALGANKPLAAVFQTELRHSAKFLAEFSQSELKQYFDLIREIVRRGQESGTFRSGVSDKIVANCFFGSLDEMVTSWVLSDHDYPLVGAATAVADVIIAGLKA